MGFYAAKGLKADSDIDIQKRTMPWPAEVLAARLGYLETVKLEVFVVGLKDAFAASETNAAIAGLWAPNVLRGVQRNQAYLLGAMVSVSFDNDVTRSAEILRAELEAAIARRPPNKLLLRYKAKNAGVAMKLAEKSRDAGQILDGALTQYPDLLEDLAELRATIYLQEGKEKDALDLLSELKRRPELQIMASEIEAKIGKERRRLLVSTVRCWLPCRTDRKFWRCRSRGGLPSAWHRKKADEAADELAADFVRSPDLLVFRSAYHRAFEIKVEGNDEDDDEDLSRLTAVLNETARSLLNCISDAETWDFATRLHTAEELFAQGHAREAATLLRDKVNLSKESVVLQILCDACVSAGSAARPLFPFSSSLTCAPNTPPSPLGTMRPNVFRRPRIWLLRCLEMLTRCHKLHILGVQSLAGSSVLTFYGVLSGLSQQQALLVETFPFLDIACAQLWASSSQR